MSPFEAPLDPFKPLLPLVGEGAIAELSQNLRDPRYIDETVSRIMTEQPTLLGCIGMVAEHGARDREEMMQGVRTAAFLYALLEAQQRIEQQQPPA